MKKIKILLAISFISSIALAQNNTTLKIAQERSKLKNWAFCDYLSKSYKQYTPLFISDGSQSGYFETGAYNLKVYAMIDSLVMKNIKLKYSKYKSKENHSLILMGALDFYNSKILEEAINKLDNEIDLKKLSK